MIECENLVKIYTLPGTRFQPGVEVIALQGLDLSVADGEMIGIVGESGSGKSTLLNLVGGLDRPTGGELYFDGQMLSAMDDAALTQLRRERIGFVFQSFALLPTYSTFENVEFALRLSGRSVEENRKRAVQCLKAVGLANRQQSRPDELSGGQQ